MFVPRGSLENRMVIVGPLVPRVSRSDDELSLRDRSNLVLLALALRILERNSLSRISNNVRPNES